MFPDVWPLNSQVDPNFERPKHTSPPSTKQVRFVTSIKHANVNPHGRICLSILDCNYTVETTLHNVLASVFGLLLQPETSDPRPALLQGRRLLRGDDSRARPDPRLVQVAGTVEG